MVLKSVDIYKNEDCDLVVLLIILITYTVLIREKVILSTQYGHRK